MPRLLRYLNADIRAFYSEAAISKPGVRFPGSEDLEEWFFLETVAGDVFYQVRERVLSADMLVLMAQGLDDDEIISRLALMAGTTTHLADDTDCSQDLRSTPVGSLPEQQPADRAFVLYYQSCGYHLINLSLRFWLREPNHPI